MNARQMNATPPKRSNTNGGHEKEHATVENRTT